MDIIEIILNLPEQLLQLADTLAAFLFSTVTIGGTKVSFWLIIAGVGIVFLILFSIIKS